MAGGAGLRRRLAVAGLVVEEEVGLELAQERALVEPAQEHGLVHLQAPVHQRADGPLVRRRAARGDQRGTHAHAGASAPRALQAVQRLEQGHEGPRGQGSGGVGLLVALEGVEPVTLEHLLGLVREQHRVAVEGDAHLVGMRLGGLDRIREHPRRRKARLERGTHVVAIGGQEQIGLQGHQIGPGGAAAGEHASLQAQAGLPGRAKDPQAADRVVARDHHHLDPALRLGGVGRVEGKQLAHQGARHARRGRPLETLALHGHVGRVVVALEDAVLLLEVEHRARGNRHHQLAFERDRHFAASWNTTRDRDRPMIALPSRRSGTGGSTKGLAGWG
jgi:hypothetical protein